MQLTLDTDSAISFVETSGKAIFDHVRMVSENIHTVPWWVLFLIMAFAFTASGYFLRIALDDRLKRRIRHRLQAGSSSGTFDPLSKDTPPAPNKEKTIKRVAERFRKTKNRNLTPAEKQMLHRM